MLVLALALFFTMAVGRSMTRPLRRLRSGALEVAGVRLPETVRRMTKGDVTDTALEVEPIDVDSTDEIGEVARAFDQVHREAVRLAANEAALRGNVNAMFVNLSRRSPVAGGTADPADRRPGAGRAGRRAAGEPVPDGPPGHPDAPQLREPAGPGGPRAVQAVDASRWR